MPVNRDDFFDVNDRWLKTVGPSSRQHLRLDLPGATAGALTPPAPNAPSPGDILNARQSGEIYQAEFLAARPAWALFKMTWHPDWKASLDGQPRETSMLSPGFVGIPVPAGPPHPSLPLRAWKLEAVDGPGRRACRASGTGLPACPLEALTPPSICLTMLDIWQSPTLSASSNSW